jgi:hypothetical protein
MTTGGAGTMISTMVTDLGTVLASGLPVILGLVAILIGLFFVVRLITKKIGGTK